MPLLCGDSRSCTDIFKRSVAAIVKKNVADGREFAGRAVHWISRGTASLAGLRAPVEIAGNEEIQFSIVVVVEKSCGNGPTACGNPSLRGHVGKRAIAVVVVQNIFPVIGHVDIRKSVVVIVTDGDTHSVVGAPRRSETSFLGNIRETTVLILAV
jgi:hypothetical protein